MPIEQRLPHSWLDEQKMLVACVRPTSSVTVLGESPRKRAANTRAQTPYLLKGLIFGPTGRAMTPAHTRKGGKLYRYYVSTDVLNLPSTCLPCGRPRTCQGPIRMVPMIPMPCSCGPASASPRPIFRPLLARQDEATGTRARELLQPRRDMLAATSLRIEQGAHRLSDGVRLNRAVTGRLAILARPGLAHH